MSAPSCIFFYGIKELINNNDIDSLEDDRRELVSIYRKNQLQVTWDNFAEPEEKYYLLIGKVLAKLGPENVSEFEILFNDFQDIINQIDFNIQKSGISGTPALHAIWRYDV